MTEEICNINQTHIYIGHVFQAVHNCNFDELQDTRLCIFFFQAEDGIRGRDVTGVQTCALPIFDLDHLTPAEKEKLSGQGPGFPYVLRPGAKTLIIGPGGGWDVSRAIASGSKDVTGVEINPITATTIMRERFPELSRRLYFRPEVHMFVEDGRSFVRR